MTQNGGDRKEPPAQRGQEASAPRRISVLVVDRARLEREALAYFLRVGTKFVDGRAKANHGDVIGHSRLAVVRLAFGEQRDGLGREEHAS